MRRFILLALPAIAGFILGNLAGDHLAMTRNIPAQTAGEGVEVGHTNRGAPLLTKEALSEKHDLSTLLRWQFQKNRGDTELQNEIGRMNNTAIRELITGLLEATQSDGLDVQEILRTATKELFHREGDKALEWADRLAPESGRMRILEQVIMAAAGDSAEFALPWIGRYEVEFGKGLGNPFAAAAIIGATQRGAEDLMGLREIYGDCSPRGPIPDDFDFNLLFSQNRNLAALAATMEYWTAKDRDAAWAGVQEIVRKDSNTGMNFFGSVFTGIAATEGEQKAAHWISNKLDELPPDLRERAISTLLTNQLTQNTAYDTVMAEFPHDADRVALAASIINPFANPTVGSNVLEALGSESLQVQALIRSAKTFSRVASDPDDRSAKDIHSYFGKTMDQLNLSPASREKVSTVLNTPQDPYPE